MSKPSDLGSLKIGSYILLPHSDQPSGEACRIVEYDTSKPGKHGAAKDYFTEWKKISDSDWNLFKVVYTT